MSKMMRPAAIPADPIAAGNESEIKAAFSKMEAQTREAETRARDAEAALSSAEVGLDWDAVKDPIINQVRNSLLSILEGAAADIQEFVDPIAMDYALCLREGNEAGLQEVKAQMRAVAEAKRIELVNEQWKLIDTVLDTAFNIGLALLSGVIIKTAAGLTAEG